jgi:hypothetical protein
MYMLAVFTLVSTLCMVVLSRINVFVVSATSNFAISTM